MSNRISFCATLAMLLVATAGGCAQFEGARLYNSGTAALDRGEAERAIADLELAAARVPEASEVQNHLGLAYAAAGRDDDALNAFRRAVDLDCENTAAEKNLRAALRHDSRTASP
jgi:Flp pilus assembly protein TadD